MHNRIFPTPPDQAPFGPKAPPGVSAVRPLHLEEVQEEGIEPPGIPEQGEHDGEDEDRHSRPGRVEGTHLTTVEGTPSHNYAVDQDPTPTTTKTVPATIPFSAAAPDETQAEIRFNRPCRNRWVLEIAARLRSRTGMPERTAKARRALATIVGTRRDTQNDGQLADLVGEQEPETSQKELGGR